MKLWVEKKELNICVHIVGEELLKARALADQILINVHVKMVIDHILGWKIGSYLKMKYNYYDVLEVSQSASKEVIKAAYKTLAKRYHPDTNEFE